MVRLEMIARLKARRAAPTAISRSTFPGQAVRAAVPIRSSCSQRAGQLASSAPSNSPQRARRWFCLRIAPSDAEVDLGMNGSAYLLRARLKVSLPGIEREVAQGLVDLAHETCPYSKATRGNIDVEITLV